MQSQCTYHAHDIDSGNFIVLFSRFSQSQRAFFTITSDSLKASKRRLRRNVNTAVSSMSTNRTAIFHAICSIIGHEIKNYASVRRDWKKFRPKRTTYGAHQSIRSHLNYNIYRSLPLL